MKYIIESKTGRKREAKEVICSHCNTKFLNSLVSINKTKNHYCTLSCYHNSVKGATVRCAYCNKEVYKQKSKLKNSKSGHYFCSPSCQSKGKTVSFGLKEVQPSFYDSGYNYRKRAFRILDNRCSVCGYNTIEVLEVHHKDHNRNNNQPNNWDILCPTHHKEYQVGLRKYKEE